MTNKKINLKKLIVVIVLLIILIVSIVYIVKHNKKNVINESDTSLEIDEKQDIKENGYEVKKIENEFEDETKIDVEDIYVRKTSGELAVVTTIKNNSRQALENGFIIEIDLLDKDKNTITTISENSIEQIKGRSSIELINYVVDIENEEKITDAKVTYLEKKVKDNLE